MIINNGDHTYNGRPLFHGAMMNSGTYINAAGTTSTKAQKVFDKFASNAGCDPSKLGRTTIDCLRQTPASEYQAAMNTLPNYSGPDSNNLAYIRRPDASSSFYGNTPQDALRTGRYAHVPIIAGNLQDEATVFAVSSRNLVNSTESLISYFATWFPDAPRKLISDFVATYPEDPAAGLPAGTDRQYELYPQYKRNSAIQTDITFEGGRRVVLGYLSKVVSTWSYIGTYLHNDPEIAQFGTYHTSDLGTQFFLEYPTPGDNINEAYIHFVNFLNPNGKQCGKSWWPKWNDQTRKLANFSYTNVSLTRDDYRKDSLDFLEKHGSQLLQ